MFAEQKNLLDAVINAANNWRNQAAAQGVELTQINITFPGTQHIVLAWDFEANDWKIDT